MTLPKMILFCLGSSFTLRLSAYNHQKKQNITSRIIMELLQNKSAHVLINTLLYATDSNPTCNM